MSMNKDEAERIIREQMGDEKADAFLESILGPEEAAKLRDAQEELKQDQLEAARLFHDVFTNGNGPAVLEILRYKTTRLSVMQDTIGAVEIPLNPGEFMAMREGQNALVRFIEGQIEKAKEGQ